MNKFSQVILLIASLVLTACGGGSGGSADNGGMGGTGVSSGVMTKGSVIVNGVRYEDSSASISIDDTPKTAAHLQNGMVVSVSGTVDNSLRNGTAQQVNAVVEVRGTVTSKDATSNPQRFVVLGQTVMVDDLTVYSNTTFAAITATAPNPSIVEVHGLRDAAGNIRATRVEGSQSQQIDSLGNITGMTNPSEDEIRGIISNLSGSTFNLGSQVVRIITGAQILPNGATITNGRLVEVHCATRPCIDPLNQQFQATRIEVEDNSNRPGNGQRFEVEGLISGFGIVQGQFFVAGVPVTTSGSTTFRGGISTDLANNIKVEAEGSWNGTHLVANKIEFKRSVIRLQGIVLASPAPTINTFTLHIGDPGSGLDIAIERDGFTPDPVPPVSTPCVQVRGQRKAVPGTVVILAGEIDTTCSHGGDHALQATLDAKSDPSLTLLGFTINVGGGGVQFKDINDFSVLRSVFFNMITRSDAGPPPVAGTLVRVRFNNSNLSNVSEVELED
jgi:Domain of unknown function (DUF5666)